MILMYDSAALLVAESTTVSEEIVNVLALRLCTYRYRQVGDQLDRGDNEIEILYFLERLAEEAKVRPRALTIAVIESPDTLRIKTFNGFLYPETTSYMPYSRPLACCSWSCVQGLSLTALILGCMLKRMHAV